MSHTIEDVHSLKRLIQVKKKELQKAELIIERQGALLKKYGLLTDNEMLLYANKREELCEMRLRTAKDWGEFKKVFEQLHYGFYTRLTRQYKSLTPGEQRLALLLRLELSAQQMAKMLCVSPDSVFKAMYRFKKKIFKESGITSLREVIINL